MSNDRRSWTARLPCHSGSPLGQNGAGSDFYEDGGSQGDGDASLPIPMSRNDDFIWRGATSAGPHVRFRISCTRDVSHATGPVLFSYVNFYH